MAAAVEAARPLLRRLAGIARQIELRLAKEQAPATAHEPVIPRYVKSAADTRRDVIGGDAGDEE